MHISWFTPINRGLVIFQTGNNVTITPSLASLSALQIRFLLKRSLTLILRLFSLTFANIGQVPILSGQESNKFFNKFDTDFLQAPKNSGQVGVNGVDKEI